MFGNIHEAFRSLDLDRSTDEGARFTLTWLHGVGPGEWVAVGQSLDRTSVSWMFVSRLYAISAGWINILATSVRACRSLQIVDGWFMTITDQSFFSSYYTVRL